MVITPNPHSHGKIKASSKTSKTLHFISYNCNTSFLYALLINNAVTFRFLYKIADADGEWHSMKEKSRVTLYLEWKMPICKSFFNQVCKDRKKSYMTVESDLGSLVPIIDMSVLLKCCLTRGRATCETCGWQGDTSHPSIHCCFLYNLADAIKRISMDGMDGI